MAKLDLATLADDFRDLDLKEIAGWAPAPKAVALLFLVVGIVGAGWWFDWQVQMEELETVRGKETQLKDEYRAKKRQAVNAEAYRQQLSEIDRSFGALLKQLPNKAEMDALLVDINQAGLGRGLQFDLFRPGAEAVREFYAELPITLKVQGGYHDLGEFASDVAKLSRIVTLNDIAISNGKEAGSPLLLDATAKTFRYLDDAEIAAQKKAAQDAKGAKP